MKAAKYAILAFTRMYQKVKSIHIQMDNKVAPSCLEKIRGDTQSKTLITLSKEVWEYLLVREIMITAEYFPGTLNKEADFQSRTVKDSSEWKLKPQIFQSICQKWGKPDIDLLASRVSHQVAIYTSWKLDPFSKDRDAFQISWTPLKRCAFLPSSLIGRVLSEVQSEQAALILVI